MMSTQGNKRNRLLFRLIKGLIYGSVVGLIFGSAIYLLATAVNQVSPLPWDPGVWAGLIFGASVTAGTAVEYSDWLKGYE